MYIHDTLNKAGVNHPHRGDNNHPLSARDWYNAKKIGGFEKVTDGSSARGDVLTSGSHMGIQTDTPDTTGIDEVMASSSASNGEVKRYRTITYGDHVRWRCKD